MHSICTLTWFCVTTLVAVNVQAKNILFFHLAATVSHRTSIWPLAEKLADKGHNITYIFPLDRKVGSHPNIEEITPSKIVPIMKEIGGELDINLKLNNTVHLFYQKAFDICFDLCKAFFDSPEIKSWLNRENLHYDLFIIDSSFQERIYGVLHKFKAKHITFIPAILPYHWDTFGIVPPSATIPPTMSFFGVPPKTKEMDIVGRIKSTLEPLVWRFGHEFMYLPKIKALIEERMNIPGGLPALQEFEKNASLVFSNFYFVEDFPLALPPYFVSYSGLWCSRDKVKDRKPLPNELAQFVEEKDSDGFVYVSLGSSVIASTMPTEFRNTFVEAFKSFPKLKFLWRWTGEVPSDKPENLWMQSWFPQLDILAHPKIKGFVTQCGRPSTQEALCHGVPLITVPIFGDQDYNADRMEQVGAAINIDVMKMTADTLKKAIKDLVYTDKYRNRMSELSQISKDRPIDPLDNIVYWTEYVLRQKDTSLMKPLGMDLAWYQRRLLDVYIVIAAALATILSIVISALFLIFKIIIMFIRTSAVNSRKNKGD